MYSRYFKATTHIYISPLLTDAELFLSFSGHVISASNTHLIAKINKHPGLHFLLSNDQECLITCNHLGISMCTTGKLIQHTSQQYTFELTSLIKVTSKTQIPAYYSNTPALISPTTANYEKLVDNWKTNPEHFKLAITKSAQLNSSQYTVLNVNMQNISVVGPATKKLPATIFIAYQLPNTSQLICCQGRIIWQQTDTTSKLEYYNIKCFNLQDTDVHALQHFSRVQTNIS